MRRTSSATPHSSIRKINCDSGLKGCVIHISASTSEQKVTPKDRPAQFRIEVRQLFLFIQMAGAGVHLLRQFFQPLRIATVHPFQRRQRTPVDLFSGSGTRVVSNHRDCSR